MKIIMPGYSGYDWDGHIVGWAPGHETEIPDDNAKAVAWARGWLKMGAILVEDVAAKPEPPEKPPEKPPARSETRTETPTGRQRK